MMPRKPILPAVPLKFQEILEGVLKVKPPKKQRAVKKPRARTKARP